MAFQNNQIDLESLPSIDHVEMMPIEKSYYKVILINSIILYAVILAIPISINFINTDLAWSRFFPWLMTALGSGIAVHFFIYRIGFKLRKYGLRERDISYVQGVLTSKHYTLPFVRTQHVEIRQGFISKQFSLSNLKVFTAGDGDDVTIKGLTTARAEEIKTFIIAKINDSV